MNNLLGSAGLEEQVARSSVLPTSTFLSLESFGAEFFRMVFDIALSKELNSSKYMCGSTDSVFRRKRLQLFCKSSVSGRRFFED